MTHGSGENADRNGNGQFAAGNTVTREGVPNRASWVREQVLATCDAKAIEKLKQLRLDDPALY